MTQSSVSDHPHHRDALDNPGGASSDQADEHVDGQARPRNFQAGDPATPRRALSWRRWNGRGPRPILSSSGASGTLLPERTGKSRRSSHRRRQPRNVYTQAGRCARPLGHQAAAGRNLLPAQGGSRPGLSRSSAQREARHGARQGPRRYQASVGHVDGAPSRGGRTPVEGRADRSWTTRRKGQALATSRACSASGRPSSARPPASSRREKARGVGLPEYSAYRPLSESPLGGRGQDPDDKPRRGRPGDPVHRGHRTRGQPGGGGGLSASRRSRWRSASSRSMAASTATTDEAGWASSTASATSRRKTAGGAGSARQNVRDPDARDPEWMVGGTYMVFLRLVLNIEEWWSAAPGGTGAAGGTGQAERVSSHRRRTPRRPAGGHGCRQLGPEHWKSARHTDARPPDHQLIALSHMHRANPTRQGPDRRSAPIASSGRATSSSSCATGARASVSIS